MSAKISESPCGILINHEPVHNSDGTAYYEATMRDYSDRCDSIVMNLEMAMEAMEAAVRELTTNFELSG
jgi:hypothetical protein